MSDVIDVKTGSKAGKIVAAVIVLLIVVIIGCGAFTTVRAGHTGVVVTFGKVSSSVLGEGLHLKIPFIQQVVISVQGPADSHKHHCPQLQGEKFRFG